MRPLVLALLLALAASLVRSEPRVIGRTESNVRILRGNAADSTAAAKAPPGAVAKTKDDVDLAGPPPASTSPEALALARRLVSAFGGKTALTAWLERGERRGTQRVYVPAQVTATFVERRAEGRIRLDIETAGLAMSVADGPSGGWQRFLGLVTDLPQAQRDELDRARAHDEGLLLLAANDGAPARIVQGPSGNALAIWGPSGSATLFVPGTEGPLAEIRFLERAALRDDPVPQTLQFSDWRELEPERSGRSGPAGTRVPFSSKHLVEGTLVEEDALSSVNLLAAFDDSVFARPGSSERTTGEIRRAVLPLTRHGEHHFADVSINGGPPRTFLIDTGAGLTAISRELADTLGLALGGAMDIVGLGGGVEARSATLQSVGFGTLTRQGVSCLVLDFDEMRRSMGLEVEGILGYSALNRYAVTFDFARGTLELAQNAPPKAPGAGGARVRMETLGGQSLVEGSVEGGATGSFIVDTGSWISFVPSDVGRKVAALRRVPGVPFIGADGRVLEAEAVRARSLAIGAARVDRPILLYVTSGGANDPVGLTLGSGERGVLGANVLRRYRVTLDYPRSEFVLEARDRGAPAPDEGLAEFGLVGPGIVLRAAERGFTVRHVVAESPAARAGVKPGEQVLAIDDRALEGLTLPDAQRMFSGPTGSAVRVRLEGRTLRLTRVALL
jgi:predicted aspartyl protease